jgi:hypothetical protein
MVVYRCTQCGVMSPHDKPCFRCGCKEKEKILVSSLPLSKKARRKRFGGGGTIIRIGI